MIELLVSLFSKVLVDITINFMVKMNTLVLMIISRQIILGVFY